MGKKRIEWIDISKGIAILLVIFGHVSILPWAPYKKLIFSVHMPLFFIVAGLTASGKTGIQYIKETNAEINCTICDCVGYYSNFVDYN